MLNLIHHTYINFDWISLLSICVIHQDKMFAAEEEEINFFMTWTGFGPCGGLFQPTHVQIIYNYNINKKSIGR